MNKKRSEAVLEFRGVDKAAVLYGLGKYREALTSAERILKRAPKNVRALLVKAKILIELGRPDESLEITEGVLKKRPNDIEALLTKAFVCSDLGQHDEAARLYASLDKRKLRGEDRRYLYSFWLEPLLAEKRWKAASWVLSRGLERFPEDDMLLHFRKLLPGWRTHRRPLRSVRPRLPIAPGGADT